MNFFANRITLLLLCCMAMAMFGQDAFAQGSAPTKKKGYRKYVSIMFGGGTAQYFGDLTTRPQGLSSGHGQGGIGVRFRQDEHWSLLAELNYYSIGASDANSSDIHRKPRNLSFRARNFEAATMVQYDFVPRASLYARYSRRPHYSPYVYAGIGVTSSSPKAEYNGTYYSLRNLGLEGKNFSLFQPVLPIGIGFKLKISPEADILFDYGYRITFTDYLDGVGGGKYSDLKGTSDVAIALNDRRPDYNAANPDYKPYTQYQYRGSSKKLDAYSFFSIKYQYTFSKAQFKRFRRGFNGSVKSRLNRYR